jgi:N-acyl-D-aspartate/D-glutamate deacylase
MNRGWVEAGIRELDTAAGQLAAVRRIIACESDEAVLALIADPAFRKAFVAEYAEKGAINGGNALEAQTVVTVGDAADLQSCLGRTLGEIAQAEGLRVVEVLLDLGLRSKLALQLKSPQITSADPRRAARLMAHSAVIPGNSDGGAHTKTLDMAHYPTDFLIWLVREEGLVTLEEMHFQLGLKSARAVQIQDRGALLPGYWADVLVYDLDALFVDRSQYQIVHDMPLGDWRRKTRAGGYEWILVNGVVTHQNGQPTGAAPGRLVRVTRDRRAPFAAAAE